MATLSLGTLLAALTLLAGDNRQIGDQMAQGPAVAGRIAEPSSAETPPAQPAAKDGTAARPGEAPERPADQQPGTQSAPAVANPFAPSSELSTMRIPPPQVGPVRDAARGGRPSHSLSMPANPFVAIPPGAAADRPAAAYGAPPGPASRGGGGKPFSDYRPSSPISPYMSLYARPTLGVDNYNAYVRPQLEQQAFNRQVRSTVREIESDLSLRDLTPRSPEQVPGLHPVGPAVGAAGFMSFQQYYPGIGQSTSSTRSRPQPGPSRSR